jgi:hypothetical protein
LGTLRGTFEVTEPASIVNISHTGVLIQSPLAVAVDSIQSVRLNVLGREAIVDARVRHVERDYQDGSPFYLVGLEFVSAPNSLLETIERLKSQSEGGSSVA